MDAAQLLTLCAFLNPDGILVEFLEAGRSGLSEPLKTLIGDSFAFYDALRDLERYSLIHNDRHTISIHRLVQTMIKDSLNIDEEKRFMKMTAGLLLSAFPQFEEDKRQIC